MSNLFKIFIKKLIVKNFKSFFYNFSSVVGIFKEEIKKNVNKVYVKKPFSIDQKCKETLKNFEIQKIKNRMKKNRK